MEGWQEGKSVFKLRRMDTHSARPHLLFGFHLVPQLSQLVAFVRSLDGVDGTDLPQRDMIA